MARPPLGEHAMSNAQRQARHRDRRRGDDLKLWRPAPPLRGPRAAEWFPTPPPPRAGQYRVIYADPPWLYETWGRTGAGKSGTYAKLPLPVIKALPVAEWAHPERCVLFLWAASPLLPQCLQVFEPWGFEYATVGFVWAKLNPRADPALVRPADLSIITGKYTRGGAEFLLIGRRGGGVLKALKNRRTRQVVMAPRREHSEKPAIFRELIEAMYDGPYLELFARHTRPGWDAWGNQVGLLDSAPDGPRRAGGRDA
jgi:N6-adenosine-specific RNA methylase IME4